MENFEAHFGEIGYFGQSCGLTKEQSDAVLAVEAQLAKVGFPGKRDEILEAILKAPEPHHFAPVSFKPKTLKTNWTR